MKLLFSIKYLIKYEFVDNVLLFNTLVIMVEKVTY